MAETASALAAPLVGSWTKPFRTTGQELHGVVQCAVLRLHVGPAQPHVEGQPPHDLPIVLEVRLDLREAVPSFAHARKLRILLEVPHQRIRQTIATAGAARIAEVEL